MSALLILSLLGIALFIPALSDEDEDIETPVEPEPPLPPEPEPPVSPDPPIGDDLDGTAGDDVLTVTGTQSANGLGGNDTLTTGPGAREGVLNGGAGDDLIVVDADTNFVNGDEGNDTIRASGIDGFLNGGLGDDRFEVSGSVNNANGDEGNDSFFVSGAGHGINGGDGEDVVDVTGRNHFVFTDADNDSLSIDATDTSVNTGSGDDDIFSAEDSADLQINAGDGNDTISAAGTRISIDAGDGRDEVSFGAASGEVRGGSGDDTIEAAPSDRGLSGSLFGDQGNDRLSAFDTFQAHGGVSLDGGAGDDVLTTSAIMDFRSTQTSQDTLTGGDGRDIFEIELNFIDSSAGPGDVNMATITDFTRGEDVLNLITNSTDDTGSIFQGLEIEAAPDGSYSDVIARYSSTTEGVADTLAIVRVQGVGDLAAGDINLSTGDVTTSGDDYISSGGVDGDRELDATISGGMGDDLLLHEGRDDADALVMEGGAGNDTLIADEIEFSNPTTLDGGAGDDVLRTQLFSNATPETVDTFITGEGSDTIEISEFVILEGTVTDVGLAARVTDFTPGEDMIVIDTTPYSEGGMTDVNLTVTQTENVTEGYTDVNFSVAAVGTDNGFSGIVRLEGLTGLSAGDVVVTASNLEVEAEDRPAYLFTETSEQQF